MLLALICGWLSGRHPFWIAHGWTLASLAAEGPALQQHPGIGIDVLFSPLQLTPQDLEHLAALTGLTSLAYSVKDEGTDPLGAISQLTRLRSLQLGPPSRFNNAQLTRLSMLCGLTSLQIKGR
jgi:hypothetical protein